MIYLFQIIYIFCEGYTPVKKPPKTAKNLQNRSKRKGYPLCLFSNFSGPNNYLFLFNFY